MALLGAVVTAFDGRIARAPDAGRTTPPTNVLLITLDTVRADHLGAYGNLRARTPVLDSMAREGIRFADATTQAPLTAPAHVALLTGQYPSRFGVRDNAATPLPDEATTLAELVATRGFATGGFIGAFLLDRPYGFAQGFATFQGRFTRVDSERETEAQRRGDAVVDDALAWLSSLPAARSFFAWVHLYDAHAPYEPPSPFRERFANHPYDGEVGFVDGQVGRLLDTLRTRGRLENTIVVAIGDHGEGLGDHGEEDHGLLLYDSVLAIPWLMMGPGLPRGRVVADQVRAIDLVPTLCELLGMGIPAAVDGESLVPLLRGSSRPHAPPSYAETYYGRLHFGWSELRSLRTDSWKAIDGPQPELYDLRSDPKERQNLYRTRRLLADRMIGEVSRQAANLGGSAPELAKQPDPETLQRLRSLGYIGTTVPGPTGRGLDPKEGVTKLREYRRLTSEAIADLRAGRSTAAAGKLKRLIAVNERAYDLHLFLGHAFVQQRKLEEALGEYTTAAALNPESVLPLLASADVELQRGRAAAARQLVEGAVRLEPASFEVQKMSGRVLEQEGRLPEALSAYERAVDLNPANPRSRALLASMALRLQRLDLAETNLRALIEMNYQPARTWYGLGRVAELKGSPDEAARHYRQALRADPGLQMARDALQRLGRP